MRTPFSFAACITKAPPATKVSLFAKATSFFASMAAKVGRSPTMPTTEFNTRSASCAAAAKHNPSMPETTVTDISATAIFSCFAASKSKTATSCGLNSRICFSSNAIFWYAANAVTDRPRPRTTSNV